MERFKVKTKLLTSATNRSKFNNKSINAAFHFEGFFVLPHFLFRRITLWIHARQKAELYAISRNGFLCCRQVASEIKWKHDYAPARREKNEILLCLHDLYLASSPIHPMRIILSKLSGEIKLPNGKPLNRIGNATRTALDDSNFWRNNGTT